MFYLPYSRLPTLKKALTFFLYIPLLFKQVLNTPKQYFVSLPLFRSLALLHPHRHKMPRQMDILIAKRSQILTLHQYTNKSQQEIARIAGVCQPTISRVIQQWKKSGTLAPNRRGRCGRKSKTTPQTVQMLLAESEKDPRKTSHDLRRDLERAGVSVSARTVRRRLVEAGRIARRPIKKQLLTDVMKAKRLAWAKRLESWTSEDWRKVLFSDESQFLVQGQRSQHVRRTKGEPIRQEHIEQHVKHPQKKMFWGCFSYNGVGSLSPVEGTMNANHYAEIIHKKVLKDMEDAFPSGDGVFQHDRAPSHTAKKITQLLEEKNVQVLDWPGNSPDLAPIENLWSIIKSELRKRDCTTQTKLMSAIIDTWFGSQKIEECCKKLVDSMPKRVQLVILNEGGHTNY